MWLSGGEGVGRVIIHEGREGTRRGVIGLAVKDVAQGLPVGYEVGFQLAGLVVGFGEGEGEADVALEHVKLAAEVGVGFVGQVIEQASAYAGGGYAHVQTFRQPAGRQP